MRESAVYIPEKEIYRNHRKAERFGRAEKNFKLGGISNCWKKLYLYHCRKKKSFDQEAIGNAQLVKEAKEAAKSYKEKKFYEGKPSATEQPLEMLIKETSKQKACESNTSFKEGRLVKIRI